MLVRWWGIWCRRAVEFAAKKTIKMAMIAGAFATTALLSACSGNNAAGNSSPAKNEAATAAAVEQVPEGGGQGAATRGSGAADSGTVSNGNVNCSQYGGRAGAPGRPKMDLIAVAATDGTTPGCTEAFTVITEYYQKLPQAEGPGERVLHVQGRWTCARQADSAGSQSAVVCGVPNSSLQLETRPSAQVRKFPNTAQEVQFTGYDAGVQMVRFQLVTRQEGGPDGSHYVPLDGKTYRLPLRKGGRRSARPPCARANRSPSTTKATATGRAARTGCSGSWRTVIRSSRRSA